MYFKLIVIASLLQCVASYRSFQMKIPNGGSVPHPCKPNFLWQGVGHFIDEGTGVRNPFGVDFAAEGFTWTTALCQKDSDGDGLTNGQELGDPNCEWKENAIPSRLDGLSHPGICDPWDSPTCFSKPMTHPQYANQEEWMREVCKPDEFVCEGLTDPAVRNISIRMPPTKVPSKETIYMCQVYDLTTELQGDFHLIAVEPIINNSNVVHHIAVLGCYDNAVVTPEPYECGMAASELCLEFISVWTVGIAGECLYKNMGITLGEMGFKRVALQFHWNNPEERDDWIDSSGVKLIYTPNKRQYDAGMLMIGSDFFTLPPGQKEIDVKSTCSGVCTQTKFKGPVHVTMAWNHMHYAGVRMHIEVRRNNTHFMYLTNDPVYSYDSPQMYMYDEAPVELLPGDEIITTCTYTTYTREKTTFFGDATSAEMCYGFITYYPKQNMEDSYCLDAYGISYCDAGTYAECPHLFHFYDKNAVTQMDLYKSVTENCQKFYPCAPECLETLLMYKKTDSCMNDKYWEYLQARVLSHHTPGQEFLSRVASCQTELHLKLNGEEEPSTDGNGDGDDAPVTRMSVTVMVMIMLLSWIVTLVQH